MLDLKEPRDSLDRRARQMVILDHKAMLVLLALRAYQTDTLVRLVILVLVPMLGRLVIRVLKE
jgi:hypothetical protein